MPTHRKLFRFRVLLTLSLAYGCSPISVPLPENLTQQAPVNALAEIKLLSAQEIEDVKASGLIEANNQFSWKLFEAMYQQQSEKNLFVSPLSAAMALQMTLQGANAETAAEMRQALKLEGIDNAGLRKNYPLLLRRMQRPAEDITLELANSFWAEQKFTFYPEFLSSVRNDFQAQVENLDFFKPDSVAKINAWSAKATHNKIPNVIEKIENPELVVGFLINAIYFNARWNKPFEQNETRNKAFKLEDGRTVQVPMMRQFSTLPYLPPSEAFPHQGIAMPYGKAGKVRMYVFLPSTGKTLKDLHTDLQVQNFSELRRKFISEGGSLELPRFKLKGNHNLNDSLKNSGMKRALRADQADFSLMSPEAKTKQMFISKVTQVSFVDLSEEGTEASVATAVEMLVPYSSVPQRSHSMVVDHPFVFLIHDEETGQILFMGSITDPSKEN